MTLEEFNEKFDDEHQLNFYVVGLLDGEGEDDRRTAKICASANAAGGKSEDEYMPEHWRQHTRALPRPQTWDETVQALGVS